MPKRDSLNIQDLRFDGLSRSTVSFAQLIIGPDKNLDAGEISTYEYAKYCQSYGQSVSCFKNLTKNGILQPWMTQADIITSNVNLVAQKKWWKY